IKNSRKDQLHKLSTALVEEYGAIFIGNVNGSALARTRMAKSGLDAGWSLFRTMLQYKCDYAGVWFDEVDEAYSTVTCSCCKRRTGPRGLEGLRIRMGLSGVRRVSSPRHQLGREHSRGGMSPSCRRNPRRSRASRGSRKLRAGRRQILID